MRGAYLGECAVVPDIPVVREAVPDIAQLIAFDVLLDGVESFLFRDFHLRICPTRHLDNHVQNAVVLVGEERDIMEW